MTAKFHSDPRSTSRNPSRLLHGGAMPEGSRKRLRRRKRHDSPSAPMERLYEPLNHGGSIRRKFNLHEDEFKSRFNHE